MKPCRHAKVLLVCSISNTILQLASANNSHDIPPCGIVSGLCGRGCWKAEIPVRPGYYSGFMDNERHPCRAGTFTSKERSSLCEPCPPGTFALGGASKCEDCRPPQSGQQPRCDATRQPSLWRTPTAEFEWAVHAHLCCAYRVHLCAIACSHLF